MAIKRNFTLLYFTWIELNELQQIFTSVKVFLSDYLVLKFSHSFLQISSCGCTDMIKGEYRVYDPDYFPLLVITTMFDWLERKTAQTLLGSWLLVYSWLLSGLITYIFGWQKFTIQFVIKNFTSGLSEWFDYCQVWLLRNTLQIHLAPKVYLLRTSGYDLQTWNRMSWLRPGVIKQHKPNRQSIAQKFSSSFMIMTICVYCQLLTFGWQKLMIQFVICRSAIARQTTYMIFCCWLLPSLIAQKHITDPWFPVAP